MTEERVELLPRVSQHGKPVTSLSSSSVGPSKWRTPEFYFYYIYIAACLVAMFRITYEFSSENSDLSILSEGWLFAGGGGGGTRRKVDNSDFQYAGFRKNIPILFATMTGHLVFTHISRSLFGKAHTGSVRLICSLVFSLCFLFVLYGTHLIKIILTVSFAYLITKNTRGSILNPILIWIYSLTILFLSDRYHNFKFGSVMNILSFLDDMGGLQPSWWGPFNFLILKMISFSMDYYYRFDVDGEWWGKLRSHRQECKECSAQSGKRCARTRVEEPLPDTEYNFINYLAFITYAPLYLAGPIITFNDFLSQTKFNSTSINIKETVIYALKLLGEILLMELMMHCFYVVAISKEERWKNFTAAQFGVLGYIYLKLIWLKLLIIWRFFRLWALGDGVITVENMSRCMSNNYSGIEFWRNWHRSYNRWLIRYVYIPMGGSKYYMYNIWLIFTFVAVWHDLSFKLLAWGWLISLFILPEMAAKSFFKKWSKLPWYVYLCALGGSINVWTMMAANLVGFAVGLDGLQAMLTTLFKPAGMFFVVAAFLYFFSLVMIMFEVRKNEARTRLRDTN